MKEGRLIVKQNMKKIIRTLERERLQIMAIYVLNGQTMVREMHLKQ